MHNIQLDTPSDLFSPTSPLQALLQIEAQIETLQTTLQNFQSQFAALNDMSNPNGYYQLQGAMFALNDQKAKEQQQAQKDGKPYSDPALDKKVAEASKAFQACVDEQIALPKEISDTQASISSVCGQVNNLISNLQFDPNNPLELGALTMLAKRIVADANDPHDATDPNNSTQLLNQASNTIQNYAESTNDYVDDLLNYMQDLVGSEKSLHNTEQDLETAKHNLVIDSIKLAAADSWIIGCCFDGELVGNVKADENTISKDEDKINDLNVHIASLKSEITDTMTTLAGMSTGELEGLISGLSDEIKKIINLITGPNGNSEGNMQKAAIALVVVLNILQVLTTKVHEFSQQDQQFMSMTSADNFEVAVSKSQDDLLKLMDAVAFGTTLGTLLNVAEGVLTAAAVIGAVVSGGAGSIAVATVMAVFTAISMATQGKIDLTQEALDKLADAIGHGSTAAKVLADIVAAVALVVLTLAGDAAAAGATGIKAALSSLAKSAVELVKAFIAGVVDAMKAATSAAISATKEVTEANLGTIADQVIQSVEQDVGKLASEGTQALVKGASEAATAAASVPAEAGNAAASDAQAASKGLWQTMKAVASDAQAAAKEIWSAIRKPVLLTAMNFMMFNGFGDSFEAIAEKIKSKKDLKDDQVFQILKIIAGIVQAVMMIVFAHKAFSGAQGEEAEASFLKNILSKLDVELDPTVIAQFTNLLQMVGNILSVFGNLGMVDVNHRKAEVDGDIANNTATTIIYQNILNVIKNAQQQDGQKAETQIQQIAASIQEMVQKMASAENEAARLLTENAV